MDPKAKAELNGIIQDISSIIKDLNHYSYELNQFKGIGAEYCSMKLGKIADHYSHVRNKLYHL